MAEPNKFDKIVADLKSGDPLRKDYAKQVVKQILENNGTIPESAYKPQLWEMKGGDMMNQMVSDFMSRPEPKNKKSLKSLADAEAVKLNKYSAILYAAGKVVYNPVELTVYTKANQLIKKAYESYTTGKPEEYFSNIEKANTFIANNKDKFADVEEVEKFYELPAQAVMKKLQIDPEKFKQEYKRYKSLPSEVRYKDPFRKTLAKVGVELGSLGLTENSFYDKKTKEAFLNSVDKIGTAKTFDGLKGFDDVDNINILESEAVRLADSIVQASYAQVNAPKIEKLQALDKNLKEAELKLNEYSRLLNGIDAKYSQILKSTPKTAKDVATYNNTVKTRNQEIKQAQEELLKYQQYYKRLSEDHRKTANEIENNDIELIDGINSYDNHFDYQAKYMQDLNDADISESAYSFLSRNPGLGLANALTKGTVVDFVKRTNTISKNMFNRSRNSTMGLAFSLGLGSELSKAAYKADAGNDEIAFYTGDVDENGNKVLSNQIHWKDSQGNNRIQLGAIVEEGAQQLKMMAGTSMITKGLAKGASALLNGVQSLKRSANVAKALKMTDLSSRSVLNSQYGANVLTFPAVFLSTYGRTYYDNIGNFKTNSELINHAAVMSSFEAFTESFVPDIKFLKGLDSPQLGKALSKNDFARLKRMLTEGASRKEVLKRFGATLLASAKSLFQEAIVEEEVNYVLQGTYDNLMGNIKGEENYLKRNEEVSFEGAKNIAVDSLLTMSLTTLVGAKNTYKNISKSIGYDLNRPEMLDYHRYNIATNANAFRNLIAEDKTLTPEQRSKAFQTIAKHEADLITATTKVLKPSNKELGPDQESIFMYFKAMGDKSKTELKIAEGVASEEDIKLHETAEKTMSLIDQESKDWSKLSAEEKEKTWFKWNAERIMNTEPEALANSPSLQYAKWKSFKARIAKLYSENQLRLEQYKKYEEHAKELKKKIFENAVDNVQKNLENIDNLSPIQLAVLQQDALIAKSMNSDSVVESYEVSDVLPGYSKVNEIVQSIANTNRIVEINYLDKRNNEKTERFYEAGGKLINVDTGEELARPSIVFGANVMAPKYTKNTKKEASEKFLVSSLQTINQAFEKLEKNKQVPPPEVEEPVVDTTATEPVVEQPIVEQPTVEQPVIEQPEPVTALEEIFKIQNAKERKEALDAFVASPDTTAEEKVKMLQDYLNGLQNPSKPLQTSIERLISSLQPVEEKEEQEPVVDERAERRDMSLASIDPDTLTARYYTVLPPRDSDDPLAFLLNSEEISADSEIELIEKINQLFEQELIDEANKASQVRTDIEDVDVVYSDDFRPTSAFITISDEYDRNDKYNADPYVAPINKFLNNYAESIGAFKGKLISFSKFLKDVGVDIEEVRNVINEYWKNPSKQASDEAYLKLLGMLKGTMPANAIKWLVTETDNFTEAMSEVYGITNSKDKFDLITLKGFVLAVTDKDGNYVKVNNEGKLDDQGVTYVTRALPKARANGTFYSIEPFAPKAIEDGVKALYRLQEEFKNNQELEIPVTDLKYSKGYNKDSYNQNPPSGKITIQEETSPISQKNKGGVYDQNDKEVFTTELSEVDARVVAAMLQATGISKEVRKLYNEYINKIVNLSDAEKNTIKALGTQKLIEFLQARHYNISAKSLKGNGKFISYLIDEKGNLTEGPELLYTEFMKDKWYTVTFKENIKNGNRKIYFSLDHKSEPLEQPAEVQPTSPTVSNEKADGEAPAVSEQTDKSAEDILNNATWEYSRTNATVEIGPEEEIEAMSWFTRSFLSKGIDLVHSTFVDPSAFASFVDAAITLYSGSDNTMLYHEAWHRFTQHFLTKEAKTELYRALKTLISDKKYVGSEKVKYEEALAEGFRSLMLSGGRTITINVNGQTVKIDVKNPDNEAKEVANIFTRFYNFFKSLFTDKKGKPVTARQLISNYMKEASHPNTMRQADPKNNFFNTLNTARIKELTTKDGQVVSFDYSSMHELNMGLDALFVQYFNELPKIKEQERLGRKASFTHIALQKGDVRNAIGKLVYDTIKLHLQQSADRARNPQKKLEFQAILDNFENIVENATGLREVFAKSYSAKLTEEITNDEITGEEHKLEIAETYETKLSQQELASEEIINLVKLIPHTDKKGNLSKSPNWGLPYLSDFQENWLVLANNLSTLTYPEMYKKIQELSETTHPRFKYLLENLPNPDTTATLPLNTFELKVQFEQIFNMPRVNEMITILASDEENKGQLIVKYTEAGTSATREVLSTWKNDTEFKTYEQIFEGAEKIGDLDTIEKMLNFLSNIGIEFAEEEELIRNLKGKTLSDFEQAVVRIHNHLSALKVKGVKIDNPLEAVEKTYKRLKLKGEGKSLEILANLEVKTNDTIADDMILRADGERNWKYNQFNYLTKLTHALDKLSYEELIKQYPNFDTSKNPGIINSPWFRELFVINPDGTVTRSDVSSLEFVKTGGLKSEALEDSEGTVTVNLTASDKLAMDFYSFAVSGIEENVKFGDKSTAGAMNLIGSERVPVQNKDLLLFRLFDQLLGEVRYIKYLQELKEEGQKFPSNSKQFKYTDPNKGDKYAFFRKMLSDETKAKLLNEPLILKNGKWTIDNSELSLDIIQELKDYFNTVVFEGTKNKKSFKSAILAAFPQDVDPSKITPEIYDAVSQEKVKYSLDDTMLWYYMYSVSNRIDQFNLLYGDPRNYKNGSDVYKRLSAYSATGKFPSLDQADLRRVNENGRQLEQLVSPNKRNWTSKFNIVQFKNLAVNLSPSYLGKDLDPELAAAWSDYIGEDKGDKADASGAATLDFYRGINMLIGTWDNRQEAAYQDQVNFVKAKMKYEEDATAKQEYIDAKNKARASYKQLLVVFNPKKWQYAGSIFSTHTVADKIDMRAFLKFAIMPIIPSNVEGTELEKVANSMYKSNTDLYIFGSGSKMTIDQPEQSYQDWVKGKVDTFIPTVLDLSNFKEQLPIENKMKEEGIFASQMRKLLSVGQYESGKPVTGKDISNYVRYEKAVYNITNLIKKELTEKMSDPEKMIRFLEAEFEKRDVPEHVKDFIKLYKEGGRLVNSLDTSFHSFFLQGVLFSIVNNRLIKQKYSGGQFVQLPNLGYRSANFVENAEYGNDDLKFYQTVKGSNTREMEIKIAFSDKYYPLLNLISTKDGKRVQTLDRLNDLLKDEEFIEKHGKKFTMIGCRIPVQGFSTIESMRVAKFLDPIAGQVVIVPNGLTIKSGSDFDIDKLNIYEPHLDEDGDLIDFGIDVNTNVIAERQKLIDENESLALQVRETKEYIEKASETFKQNDQYVSLLNQLKEFEKEEVEEYTTDDLIAKFRGEKIESKAPVISAEKQQLIEKIKLSEKEAEELSEHLRGLENFIQASRHNIRVNKKAIRNLVSAEINALIQSVSALVLEESNALNLIGKNELDYVIGAYQGLGIPVNKDDSTLDISETVDVLSSNAVTENNNSAKSTLGIAAKSNTLFALFLKAGMKVLTPSPSSLPRNSEKDGSLSLSKLKTKPYSGKSDKYKTHRGELYIPKVLSEFISATVDVANDNRVGDPRFNFNKFIAPLYIYGIMQGTHLYDLTDIMSDPMIQEFVKEYLRLDSISYQHYVNTNVPNVKKRYALLNKNLLIESTVKKNIPEEYWKNIILTDSKGKVKLDRRGNPIEVFSVEETLQNVIAQNYTKGLNLANFIFLKNDSSKLSELSAAASWDTNTSKSFVEFEYSKQQMEKIKQDGFFEPSAISEIQYDSVISSLNVNDFVQESYSPLFSIISSDVFMNRVINLFGKTNRVKLETFVRDYTNDFMTYLFQNNAMYSETERMYDVYFNQADLLNKNNEQNIENQLKELKQAIPALENNIFLKALKFKKTRSSDWISPVLKNSNIDTATLNVYHEELLKLLGAVKYSTDPELNAQVSELTELLINATALLNGVNKTYGSFVEILPTDLFTTTIKSVLERGLTEEDYEEFEKRFIQVRDTKLFKDLDVDERDVRKDKINRFNYFISDKNVVSSQDMTPTVAQSFIPVGDFEVKAEIPQNKVSGVESFGSTVYASPEVEKILGKNATSIDMIEAGLRTRTTRSESEMAKYNIKVGDIIKHYGKSADDSTKIIYARVTAIHPKGSKGWTGTWHKEGWRAEDVEVIKRFKEGAAAIEFEVISDKGSEFTDLPWEDNSSETESVSEFSMFSGGAYGADTEFDIAARKSGIINIQHFKSGKNPSVSKRLKNSGVSATILSDDQMNEAYGFLEKTFNKQFSRNETNDLLARNYWQVKNADAVYAVAYITDDGAVSGGTNYAVQMGYEMGKPVYVWDLNSEEWNTIDSNGVFVKTDKPKLAKNFAGIGTRDIESYSVLKDGKWIPRDKYVGKEKSEKAIQAIQSLFEGINASKQSQNDKVLEGDIFSFDGIPVITTNLGGVHGAGLAQLAKGKGLIKQGDGSFKATDTVVQLPVKKVWSDSMEMNNNMELLKDSLRKLIITARQNPDKKYLLPLAGLGHGEGKVSEIVPLLVKTIQDANNISLVLPGENVNLGRKGTVRKDNTRNNLPEIKQLISDLMSSEQPENIKSQSIGEELFKMLTPEEQTKVSKESLEQQWNDLPFELTKQQFIDQIKCNL